MLKKILLYTVATVATCYIIFTMFFLPKSKEVELCNGINITIVGENKDVLPAEYVRKAIIKANMNPTGKPLDKVDCGKIEKFFNKMSIVDECQSYKTHKGVVGIKIHCKEPIMQVFDKNGKIFYIDRDGAIIENIHNAMYLPVASGNIDRKMATKELLTIALFLQENRFWNEQTEQVYFDEKREVVLVPRIGNHTVELGKPDKLKEKLDKLEKFYKKGLSIAGWNKYSKINIEIDKQVICTKRK